MNRLIDALYCLIEVSAMVMDKCPKCGNDNIDCGRIMSAGAIVYKTDKRRFGPLSSNCKTYVCMRCGYAETYVDSEYLDKIRQCDGSKAR